MAEQRTHKTLHILLFPFPSQSHMNPMIEFGKRLISKGVKVTLVPTIYISNTFISHNTTTSYLEIKPISDGFDEPGYAGASSFESYLEKFEEVGSKSLGDLVKKLQNEGNTVDAIIYDSFITWAMDVAVELGINGGAFFTQACAVNNIYFHVYNGLISIPLGSSVLVPGLPQLEYWETPSFIHNDGPNPGDRMDEKDVALEANNSEYMNWLNDKPKGSVVYVSFGSMAQLGPKQMEEIAWGLNDSNVNFLWVVRATEKEKLPNRLEDVNAEKGLIVAWCKQLDVLRHESVGCYVTHCGFNSTLEAISLGVPVVAMG
ncbi:UDP-glycosyltransferase 74G1-like protein [Tanacetum coccineum]